MRLSCILGFFRDKLLSGVVGGGVPVRLGLPISSETPVNNAST